jgi:myo-inositol-1(or 4)-monophosphatase
VSTAENEALLRLATEVATQAGTLLSTQRPSGSIEAGAKSSPTDLVTVMDTAAERLIVEALRSARPDDTIVGEEGGERAGSGNVRWLVDPLDGTVNYNYRLPHWSVSIAAVVADEVVAGVVHDASAGETWTATRGGGARCNGVVVTCSGEHVLAQALVATGFGYAAEMRAAQADVLRGVLPRVRDIRRFGSCAVDLCWTAAGRFDAYFERGPQPWDYAAGALVAQEAGARVGGVGGGSTGEPVVLAAAPGLYEELAGLLSELGAHVS